VARFSESNPEVDFAAIGVEVTSLKPGGGYQTMQGTSMVSNGLAITNANNMKCSNSFVLTVFFLSLKASPHVAGLIAALMSNGSYKKGKNLKKDLASKYAIDIDAKGKDNSTGVGFVTFLSEMEFNDQMSKGNSAQVY